MTKDTAYEFGAGRRPLYQRGVQALRRVCTNILPFALLLFLAPAQGEERPTTDQTARTLSIELTGALPGFSADAASQYLAGEMGQAGVAGWTFVPTHVSDPLAANRVEWRVQETPYAAGGVRQFIPIPSVQRLFGAHRSISVELRLYLGGQYQTMSAGETVVQGGPRDRDLAALVIKLTQDLLGEHGAHRTIESSPSPNAPTASKAPP